MGAIGSASSVEAGVTAEVGICGGTSTAAAEANFSARIRSLRCLFVSCIIGCLDLMLSILFC